MNSAGAFFVRYRVRLGYPLAVAVLFFARPTLRSIFYGAIIGVVGLAIRAWAAGYLHKQEILTVTGPYAYTRNPLVFRQRHPRAGRGRGRTFVDFGNNSWRIFRGFLFRSHEERRK